MRETGDPPSLRLPGVPGSSPLRNCKTDQARRCGPDQATASRQRAERSGKKSDGALRGPARHSRAQGTAVSSKRGIINVHQEQGARRGGDAGPGRRRRRRRACSAREPQSAATPSCGGACINLFSYQFGTHKSPNFTADVLRQGEKPASRSSCSGTANFDPALDWTFAFQGTVADFFAAGLVSAAIALHYGCIAGVRLHDLPLQHRYGSNFPSHGFNSWRSRTSTRRSAWTRACAWAWPRPRSRVRA